MEKTRETWVHLLHAIGKKDGMGGEGKGEKEKARGQKQNGWMNKGTHHLPVLGVTEPL